MWPCYAIVVEPRSKEVKERVKRLPKPSLRFTYTGGRYNRKKKDEHMINLVKHKQNWAREI